MIFCPTGLETEPRRDFKSQSRQPWLAKMFETKPIRGWHHILFRDHGCCKITCKSSKASMGARWETSSWEAWRLGKARKSLCKEKASWAHRWNEHIMWGNSIQFPIRLNLTVGKKLREPKKRFGGQSWTYRAQITTMSHQHFFSFA